jgi:hypothetical protein
MQTVQAAWESARKNYKDRGQSIHGMCGVVVEKIMKASVAERTMDNITVVIISFKNFKKCLKNDVDTLGGHPLTDSSDHNSKRTIGDEEIVLDDDTQTKL